MSIPSSNTPFPRPPLHIVFTMYGWAEEGGGTILPRQIAKALVRRGHRVSVIYTPAHRKPEEPSYHLETTSEDGVSLFAIYNRPALFYDLHNPERETDDPVMREVVEGLLRELNPDIVHYHSLLNFSMAVPDAVNQAGIPSVFTSHNYWPLCPRMYLYQDDLELCSGASSDGFKCGACIGNFEASEGYAERLRQGRRMLSSQVDRHLAVSTRVRDLYTANGHAASRIHVLHQQPETADRIWQQVGQTRPIEAYLKRPLKVGFIGSLYYQKGVHVLVKALQTFEPGEVEGHLFGSGADAYEGALHNLDRKGLFRFHGRYDPSELPRLLGEVDVVVVAPVSEDCAPLVIAEALAARCPIIGSRIGGIPDFVQEGQNGFLFDPRNSSSLASAIYRFLQDPSLLGRMQQAITPPAGFEHYLDQLTEHYHAAICERSHRAVRVAWEGSQFVRHSLALINREICLRLIETEEGVAVIPYEAHEFGPEADARFPKLTEHMRSTQDVTADVHVRHQWPPNFTPPETGAWIMIQPWEFGGLPDEWVGPMRSQVDELWVPSSHVRDGYVRSGIPADKVLVVPNGVDTERFQPDAAPYPLKTNKRFKFLFVGGTIGRKGIDILLDTYVSTFTAADDVCLVIKDMGGKSFYKGMTASEQIGRYQARPDAPEIEYLDQALSEDEVIGLYTACDALVHPYRGEGFGLPIAEAMACGLPVVVTGYGACLDFCDEQTAYLIPAREIPILNANLPPSAAGYWWAEPDRAAFAELMRRVVRDPAAAREVGRRARAKIEQGFTWDHMAARIRERIAVLAARTPLRFRPHDPFLAGDLKPLPLDERRERAFFHHPRWDQDEWKAVLVSYARAFAPDEDVCLVLWLDPTQGLAEERATERILEALSESGIDPERMPDVLVVPDVLDLNGLASLYAAADCVVPHGNALQAERARKVGSRVLSNLAPAAWREAAGLGIESRT